MAQSDSRLHPWLVSVGDESTQISAADRPLGTDFRDSIQLITGDSIRPISPDAAEFTAPEGTSELYVAVDFIAKQGQVPALQLGLAALGIENEASAGHLISGLLPVSSIDYLNELDALSFAMPVITTANVGAVTSQGDVAQRSNIARAETGLDGSGVTVGIMSDSFDALDGAAADRATGDLPERVFVLQEFNGEDASDEGRAMAQIVHDVAPGADLLYATAFGGQATFANNIQRLADAGADIIVDDIFYLAEPFFQDGIVAQSVDQAAARGVTYFSSAGNAGLSSYEADFRDSGITIAGSPTRTSTAHDWDPGAGVDPILDFTLQPDESLFLSFQWDQPYASISDNSPGAFTDMDIYLVDPNTGQAILDDDGDIIGGLNFNPGRDPVEVFRIENEDDTPMELGLVIENAGGPDPGFMKIVFFDSTSFINEKEPEYTAEFANPTTVGHSVAEGAISVGASAYFNTPPFGDDPAILNSFSSRGPATIRRDIDGNILTPFDVRQSPDIVAPDGGDTTFFGTDVDNNGFPNFFGTSASAPHAAAVAALMLQANPNLTSDEILQIMQDTADDIGAPGFDNASGPGLLQADAAVQAAMGNTNQPPQPRDDAFFATEDTVIMRSVFTNNGSGADTDPEGDTFQVASVNGSAAAVGNTITLASGASLTLNANGQFTYDPTEGLNGLGPDDQFTDGFTYTLTDGNSDRESAPAQVTFTVTGENDAPVAANDQGMLAADETLSGNVLIDNGFGPDSDPENDTLTISSVGGFSAAVGSPLTLISGAQVTVNADGSFLYDPNGAFDDLAFRTTATESFGYTVTDGFLSDTAIVTLTVRASDAGSMAVDDTINAREDDDSIGNVLTNDDDRGGVGLTVVAVNGDMALVGTPVALANGAQLTVAANGDALFETNGAYETLAEGDTVTETFTYTIQDGQDRTDDGVITVIVAGANDAPVAQNDVFTTVAGSVLTGSVLDDNGAGADTDIDGDGLTVALLDAPVNGSIALGTDGLFSYTPTDDFAGTDTFRYQVSDPSGATDTATATITVEAGNVPPVAQDDVFTGLEDQPLSGNVLEDNGNGPDEDPDRSGLALTAELIDGPDFGALSFSPNGAFTYTPSVNFFGTDTFTYRLTDTLGATDTATVTLTIEDVNDPPIALDDTFVTLESVPLVANVIADNGNGPDSDIENDPLRIVSFQLPDAETDAVFAPGTTVVTPQGASLTLNEDGGLSYVAGGDFTVLRAGESITETVVYELGDGRGGIDRAAVAITVQGQDVVFSITGLDASVTEGDVGATPARFLVTRDGPLGEAASVDFAVSGTVVDPASGTDFVGGALPAGTLAFAPGETERELIIEIAGDTTIESDESFVVTLSNATNDDGDAVVDVATATTIIRDDDINFTITGTGGADNLTGTNGDDIIGGLGGSDDIKGRRGNDELFGGSGNDRLEGDRGNDSLFGEAGNDSLRGDRGNDRLDGGIGDDTLLGRSGNDIFVFAPGYGRDVIEDFDTRDDSIDLTGFVGLTFAGFQAQSTNSGGDVIFTAAGGDVLVIEDTSLNQISANDLLLA